jgi:hypothetical protein
VIKEKEGEEGGRGGRGRRGAGEQGMNPHDTIGIGSKRRSWIEFGFGFGSGCRGGRREWIESDEEEEKSRSRKKNNKKKDKKGEGVHINKKSSLSIITEGTMSRYLTVDNVFYTRPLLPPSSSFISQHATNTPVLSILSCLSELNPNPIFMTSTHCSTGTLLCEEQHPPPLFLLRILANPLPLSPPPCQAPATIIPARHHNTDCLLN